MRRDFSALKSALCGFSDRRKAGGGAMCGAGKKAETGGSRHFFSLGLGKGRRIGGGGQMERVRREKGRKESNGGFCNKRLFFFDVGNKWPVGLRFVANGARAAHMCRFALSSPTTLARAQRRQNANAVVLH